MLNRTFGCVRVVWNRTLAARQARHASARTSAGPAAAAGNGGDAGGADIRHGEATPVQTAVKQEPGGRAPESPSFRAESSQGCPLRAYGPTGRLARAGMAAHGISPL
jgi:hypothetical protein